MTPEERKHEEEKHRRRCGYKTIRIEPGDIGKPVFLLGDGTLVFDEKKGASLFGFVSGYFSKEEVATVKQFGLSEVLLWQDLEVKE